MNPENLIIDKQVIKALSVKSRLHIIESLQEKPKTLSDLAEELGLKAPTISEHLKELETAGLIEKEETQRKWKYYSITRKAQRILSPFETRVVFTLFASLFFVFWTIARYIAQQATQVNTADTMLMQRAMSEPAPGGEAAMLVAEKAVGETTQIASSQEPTTFWIIILTFASLVAIASVAYMIWKVRILKKIERESNKK